MHESLAVRANPPGVMAAAAQAGPDGPGDGLAALVTRARTGDRAAFDALYAACVERVYAVCLRLCAEPATAERLTQDTFVQAWRRLGSFRGEAAFTTWVHRIAVNVVLNDGRTERRRAARLAVVSDPAAGSAGTSDGLEARMDLARAVAALPRGARAVLVLHDVEGYRHEEIARMLGIAPGTAKAQLHRARMLLRKVLDR